jgi:D-mannonate dehydratase (UxuA)
MKSRSENCCDWISDRTGRDKSSPILRTRWPRRVWQPQLYQKLIDRKPSPRNALEFCSGTIAEMKDGNVLDAVESYSRQQKLGYVHLRNVHAKVPFYQETFHVFFYAMISDTTLDGRTPVSFCSRP